jgi:gamma-D-glutamyl-L-lysine dipeptidyl-peptidase
MPVAIAQAALAPLLAQPNVRSEQVTQLVLGETAAVLERTGDWRKVCTRFDDYAGWVHQGYLLEVEDPAGEEWHSAATGWSDGAVLRIGAGQVPLPLRARVVLTTDGIRLPDGRRARLVSGSVREMSEVVDGARSMAPERWALAHFAGSPYQWGGVTAWGVDCSGLVQTTFAARGTVLPRDSSQQVHCGISVSLSAIQAGDLLFFRSETGSTITHVAFAGEGDTLVHSALACGGALSEPWLPGHRAASLRDRLVAARRLEDR